MLLGQMRHRSVWTSVFSHLSLSFLVLWQIDKHKLANIQGERNNNSECYYFNWTLNLASAAASQRAEQKSGMRIRKKSSSAVNIRRSCCATLERETTPNWRTSVGQRMTPWGASIGLGCEANAIIAKKLNLIEYLIDVLGALKGSRPPPFYGFGLEECQKIMPKI